MPIHMPQDTRLVLGEGAQECESRSLLQQKLVFFDERCQDYKKLALAMILPDGASRIKDLRVAHQQVKDKQEKDGKAGSNRHIKACEELEAIKPLALRDRNAHSFTRSLKWLDRLPAKRVRRVELVTANRVLIGLANGVLENCGLTLHRFTGVPMIPGSALKGVARKAAATFADVVARKADIFGSDDEMMARKGHVCFFDGFALDASIELDVCTPHYKDYYSRNGKNPDALDTENPIPAFFPAIPQDTPFVFYLAVIDRTIADEEAESLLALAQKCLVEALTKNGIGAKTRAGYGVFGVPDVRTSSKQPATSLFPPPVLSPKEKLLKAWTGRKLNSFVFRHFTEDLLGLESLDEAKEFFEKIVPAEQLANFRKVNPFWRDFVNPIKNPKGKELLARLGKALD